MPCQLCHHDPSTSSPRPYHCPTCVASALHPHRLSLASILLSNDALRTRIDAVLAPHTSQSATDLAPGNLNLALSGNVSVLGDGAGGGGGGGAGFIDMNEAARAEGYRRLRVEIREADERAGEARRRADGLKREVEGMRREVDRRREGLRRRRGDGESARHGLGKREDGAVEEGRRGGGRGEVKGTAVMRAAVGARRVLCRELGELAGLRRKRRRGRDGAVREEWTVGGMKVWDLRDMTAADPHRLTASLTHLAYLTVRASHYLGLRLPAEITLPHRDYPLPTILHPNSSYRATVIPFPGTIPTTSPSASTTTAAKTPRDTPVPRLLFLDKSLPELHKSDPSAFKNFVEGAALLAWDVAWLCRAEGVGFVDRWDEISNVGRNLYQLLVVGTRADTAGRAPVSLPPRSTSQTPPPSAMPVGRQGTELPSAGRENGASSPTTTPDAAYTPSFGTYSHGTALAFFGGATPTTYMQGWTHRLPSAYIDKVRGCLVERIKGAEWEVLDGKWVEEMMEEGVGGEGLVVGTTGVERGEEEEEGKGKANGWMRVEGRGNEGK
ncbi:hypothetical protein P152DRAFT_499247 [Eremomyces bilateralis CBS 781.70]|uniref:Autophagy-related protein 14 n=1 Tax=Eremomyces bilateralis CBS 781.70 TaxID=1392243 RepID=A0A6G1FR57_9PEZI|nr:uncharacterized protein P152DRAFT_499247 [Eremomyces bilateralis CBS 781.70]KAF1808200.1 hypothetical protein P152DRAFT_499247 [Eremomyces bilateralis CBS 781.70]